MAEFEEQYIGDTTNVTRRLDKMVADSQIPDGTFVWQINQFLSNFGKFHLTNLAEAAEFATMAAAVCSVQAVRQAQFNGYNVMIERTVSEEAPQPVSRANMGVAREALIGQTQVNEYLLHGIVSDIIRPFSETLKQPDAKLAARKLPSGVVLVSAGDESKAIKQFEFFAPVMQDTVKVLGEVFGQDSPNLDGTLFLWNDPSAEKIISSSGEVKGLYNRLTGVSMLFYHELDNYSPRLAGQLHKRFAAHELIHRFRLLEGEGLGSFAEEGLVQVLSILVSGEDLQRYGHAIISEAGVNIQQVKTVIDTQHDKQGLEAGTRVAYNFKENYRVSLSFFSAVFMLADESSRLVKLGEFAKALKDSANLETALKNVYGVNLDEFQIFWLSVVKKAHQKFPLQSMVVDLSSFAVIPFGRKELQGIGVKSFGDAIDHISKAGSPSPEQEVASPTFGEITDKLPRDMANKVEELTDNIFDLFGNPEKVSIKELLQSPPYRDFMAFLRRLLVGSFDFWIPQTELPYKEEVVDVLSTMVTNVLKKMETPLGRLITSNLYFQKAESTSVKATPMDPRNFRQQLSYPATFVLDYCLRPPFQTILTPPEKKKIPEVIPTSMKRVYLVKKGNTSFYVVSPNPKIKDIV